MKILFICSGNTCRSPMAEALLEKIAREKDIDIDVKSAGTFAFEGQRASPGAINAMEEEGIDLKGHRARFIHKDLLEEADLILTMASAHKKHLVSKFAFIKPKIFTLKEYAYGEDGDIDDPYGNDNHIYSIIKEEIKKALIEIVDSILKEGGDVDENRHRQ